MPAENEFVVGTPIVVQMTFTDEVSGELTDPSTVNGAIQLGPGTVPATDFVLADMVKISLGVWYYIFVTVGATPGYYMVQVQSLGAITGISDPAVFTLLPTSIAGLT